MTYFFVLSCAGFFPRGCDVWTPLSSVLCDLSAHPTHTQADTHGRTHACTYAHADPGTQPASPSPAFITAPHSKPGRERQPPPECKWQQRTKLSDIFWPVTEENSWLPPPPPMATQRGSDLMEWWQRHRLLKKIRAETVDNLLRCHVCQYSLNGSSLFALIFSQLK